MKLTKRLGAVLMLAMLVLAMSMSASAAKAKINKKSQTIGVGDTFTLKVKNAKKVKWSSSDATVAKVSKKGKVTGVKGGNATITGKVDKKSYKCAVTVEQVAFKSDAPTAVVVNGVVDLSTYVEVAPASLTLKWTSSDATKATVDDKGKVTGVAQGDATITATSEDGKASATLKMSVKVAPDPEERNNPNVVVINDDNFDELFDKYFGRVVISTYYLDRDGKLLNPENYVNGSVRTAREADKVANGQYVSDEGSRSYTSTIPGWDDPDDGHPVMEQRYAYYVKDGSISDLMTYGGAMMQYHINVYEIGISGSRPTFARLVASVPLGANDFSTGFGTIKVNESQKVSLARMFFPRAQTTRIFYDIRTTHNGLIKQVQGSKVVEYSVQGIDNKAMLGFDFATITTLLNPKTVEGANPIPFMVDFFNGDLDSIKSHTDFDETTDTLNKTYMTLLEDDMFRFVDFHLYKKR